MPDWLDQFWGYIVPTLAFLAGVAALIARRYSDFWSNRLVSNSGRVFCVVCLLMALPLAIMVAEVLLVDMQPSGDKYLRQYALPGPREQELAAQERSLQKQLLKSAGSYEAARERIDKLGRMSEQELIQYRKERAAEDAARKETQTQLNLARDERKKEEAARLAAREAARPEAARREKNNRIHTMQLIVGVVCFALAWLGSWVFGHAAAAVPASADSPKTGTEDNQAAPDTLPQHDPPSQ